MDSLIYDRTQSDIINKTSKGFYNSTDLNRIEKWCEYLANILNSYSYVSIVIKKDWTMSDLPNADDMERIRSNVNAIKTAFHAYTNIPENLEYMSIEKANAIEKILSEIDFLTKNMISCFRYSNTFNAGESEGLI